MRIQDHIEWQQMFSRPLNALRAHPIDFLKRSRRLMASIVAWLVGLLFLGVGFWILMLRFEGLVDRISPHNMSIGQMTVDGTDSKAYAELLRARFDYHFRRPVSIAKETGFLEMASLDAPDLFQSEGLSGALEKMTVEISGVDVARIIRFVNQLAMPDRWVIEGDFQTQSDRALLALRFSRGDRLIRTWYLERLGNPSADKSALLEGLVDDAIFQLVYDFGNKAEQDRELRKWRNVVPPPENFSFPSRTAVASYYGGRGALGRYYAHGDWRDLDLAVEDLQALRSQMPQFPDGLQLLSLALAEKRNDMEAIHVYEQLRLVLLPNGANWDALPWQKKRRILSIDLLKATSTAKLDTWQPTHEAIAALLPLAEKLRTELKVAPKGEQRAAYSELLAHTAVQLAYTYALYLSHLRDYTVAEVFGSPDAPEGLRVSASDLALLRAGPPNEAKRIVRQLARKVSERHREWLHVAEEEQRNLEEQWGDLKDGERRKRELDSRLQLISGYASYRMAEWESSDPSQSGTVLGQTFDARLNDAARQLSQADAEHPNHYLVLQLLGLVYSEPRRAKDLSIAEQYFGRAIRANPFDHYGHELLADILLRRVATRGVDMGSRGTIEKSLEEAEQAIHERETSGTAHLLRAESLIMLLEIERDGTKRRELRSVLAQHIDQAARFLPQAFGRPDPDLTWLRVVAATRQLGEEDGKSPKPPGFEPKKKELEQMVDDLIHDCTILEERWVAQERVFRVKNLDERAKGLRNEIRNATLTNWREIDIRFW
jgi:tetratricopeptide (TPR) repeat protein